MRLKVLLPFKVFRAVEGVTRIVTVTGSGSFGLLPRRMDCATALVPGLLTYSTGDGTETHIAIDEGTLVKTGADVLVCVRNAVAGTDLSTLQRTVEHEFLTLSEQEKSLRSSLAQLESGFARRLVELQRA
jgi:F-type H+-transporting ATPase subunit epsilon